MSKISKYGPMDLQNQEAINSINAFGQDLKSMSLEQLENSLEELRVLSDTLNPFLPMSDEHKAVLSKFAIVELDDPFALTNKLLVIMEDLIEELASRQK